VEQCFEALFGRSVFAFLLSRFFGGLKSFVIMIWKKLVRVFAAEVMGRVTSCCCCRGDCVVVVVGVIVVQDAVDCTN
jgi:hypothetical protein